jgi:hypothetical protein
MLLGLFCKMFTANFLLSELQYSSLQMSMSGKGSPCPQLSLAVPGPLLHQLPMLLPMAVALSLACVLKLQLGSCC